MNPRKRSVCFSTSSYSPRFVFKHSTEVETAKIEQDYSIAILCFPARHFSKLTRTGPLRDSVSFFKDVIKKKCPGSKNLYKIKLQKICCEFLKKPFRALSSHTNSTMFIDAGCINIFLWKQGCPSHSLTYQKVVQIHCRYSKEGRGFLFWSRALQVQQHREVWAGQGGAVRGRSHI